MGAMVWYGMARNKAVTMVTWCEGAVHEAWELWYGMVWYGT